ncbi:ATP-binding protein [Paucibacter sp. O1-1]|uniref:sensor histidine kinase n=1 Tax=unclassified Roseateles TaxID=2626991 RepID=UPI0021D50433|nr:MULTISPECIES: ATP-binding protein [unclassified Roseateles]MCU7373924.1 ATP-binding protein [Paucibacter sp. O1-1]MCZ7880230.1 ATP-binding protein [Paucibacter sp. M5-1]MDA3828926.1 ATP-binding protein [Paucibacter sp. O1-1]MDC6170899.1 ATP-binding protein [Paucibacter sp. XJ19-41]
MSQSLLQWTASQGFLPHGVCFQWSPDLLGLMVGADALTALAYFSIPLALMVFVKRRSDLKFNWIFVLFSAFIFLCGSTHVVDILTIWTPAYWLQGYVKAATAAVSLVTAIGLWWLMPQALRLPSTETLEKMVDRLAREVAERRAAEARLEQLSHELEARVLERTHQLELETAERLRLQDADRAREAAEQANRAKSEFLSRMSHELRTPLNAVLGFAQLMGNQAEALSAKQQEWLQHIETAGWHLLRLVDDVLDIARIESGVMRIEREPVNLQTVLQDCRDMVSQSAEARQVSLDLATENGHHVVVSDGKRLRQVLSNLLSNAIKYNRPGGHVRARLSLRQDQLHIEVEDTGVGLTAAQQAQLFQPFNRLGRERDSHVQGTGLGLVIVKQMIDALRGHIQVRSRPDVGTTFVVEWPVARA